MSKHADNTLTVLLTEEQLDALADKVAHRIKVPCETLTMAEAAEMIGISPITLRRRVQAGLIKPISGLGMMRVTRTELERFLSE